MDVLLVKLVALLRPLASVEYADAVFDAAAIGLFGLAGIAFLMNTAVRQQMRVSAIDVTIAAFVAWTIAIYIIYFDRANIRDMAKLLVPMISYTLVKNVMDSGQYRRMLEWMILGFGVTAVLSAALIVTGRGLDYVNYWTDLPRWRGAYVNSHNFGHGMTLLLMLVAVYAMLGRSQLNGTGTLALQPWKKAWLGGTAVLALYCLYMSQVRSAIVGLIVFALTMGLLLNRRQLVVAGGILAVVATLSFPKWAPALLPDVLTGNRAAVEEELQWSNIGSGRPGYWRHNVRLFGELPLDQKLAGVGIGNRVPPNLAGPSDVLDSHNDWLDMLMQTGAVGLALFAVVQVLMLRAIWRLPAPDRYVFLALFGAVNVMMFVSNSYAWRIQVAHPYYMMLAFIELRRQSEKMATSRVSQRLAVR